MPHGIADIRESQNANEKQTLGLPTGNIAHHELVLLAWIWVNIQKHCVDHGERKPFVLLALRILPSINLIHFL